MIKKVSLYMFFNTCIPLLLGLSIYLFFKKPNYISTFTEIIFSCKLPTYKSNSFLFKWLVCWGGDFFWAYALSTMLLFVLLNMSNRTLLVLVLVLALTVGTGVILEILQQLRLIDGVFDWLDVIAECIAAILSIANFKFFRKESCK